MLRTTTQISTKDNKAGDRVYFEVAEALTFRGQVVAPVGSPAVGEVVRSQPPISLVAGQRHMAPLPVEAG